MSRFRSLGARLLLAFVVVSLVATLVVAVYTAWATRSRFGDYEAEQTTATVASIWAERYLAAGGWETVIITRLPPEVLRTDVPMAVVDLSGHVVIPGPGVRTGEALPAEMVAQGTPIEVNGQRVGTLVPLAEPPPPERISPFMRDFYRALFVAGGAATALALVLAVLFSRSLRRPLRELTHATREVASGHLGLQIPVRSRDELGQLARDFNRMSADLEQAAQQRRQMTADIAHELRTPLSLIVGHTEAIQEGVLPATPETMAIIHDEALALARLVEDLRTLSLADAGQLSLSPGALGPPAILQRAATIYRPRAVEQGVALLIDAAQDLPAVHADGDRIAQVLGNLLSNALRHTPAGGTVTLSAVREGDAVRFGVRDTGPGIAAEDLPRIFDRFYRGDTSRHRESGGSGLGLGIARSLVEAQGGRIWAENAPGAGACVSFTLPLASTPDPPSFRAAGNIDQATVP